MAVPGQLRVPPHLKIDPSFFTMILKIRKKVKLSLLRLFEPKVKKYHFRTRPLTNPHKTSSKIVTTPKKYHFRQKTPYFQNFHQKLPIFQEGPRPKITKSHSRLPVKLARLRHFLIRTDQVTKSDNLDMDSP